MKKVNNYLHLALLVFILISVLCLGACEFSSNNNKCSHDSTEWIIDKNPSCTETGARHKVCTTCNTTLTSETISRTKHVEKLIPAVSATCTESGLTAGKVCANCDTTLVIQATIPAKGHTEVIVAGTKPTCTETGLADGKQCLVCNTVTLEQAVIPVIDHVAGDWIIDQSAAVGVEGKRHKECLGCGMTMETGTIDAIVEAHVHAGAEWTVVTPATCQKAGVKNFICSCGITMETASIDVIPHTEVDIPAVASTVSPQVLPPVRSALPATWFL